MKVKIEGEKMAHRGGRLPRGRAGGLKKCEAKSVVQRNSVREIARSLRSDVGDETRK